MKHAFRLMLVSSALIVFSGIHLHAEENLDKSAWTVYEIGKKKPVDTLIFLEGKFTSSNCIPYGFYSEKYQSAENGKSTAWTASLSNEKNEKMEWSGEVKGKKMTGQYVYTNKNGKKQTLEWKAKKITK